MQTLPEVIDWLSGLGVERGAVERMRQKAEARGHPIIGIGAGEQLYLGHSANEEEGISDCPPFRYAWVRFDFADDRHSLSKFKLPDPAPAAAP